MCIDNQRFLIFIGVITLGQSTDDLENHDVPYLMLTDTCTETLKETIFTCTQVYLSSTSVSVIAVPIDRYVYHYHTAEDMMKIM